MIRDFDLYSQIAFVAVVVGGLCLGLAGLFNVFLITSIFGLALGRIIYVLIGVGAGWLCYKVYLERSKKV